MKKILSGAIKLFCLTFALFMAYPAEAYTVYFDNTHTAWPSVSVYCWYDNFHHNAEWPGAPASLYDGTNNIWKYEVNDIYPNVIFTDGNQNDTQQTADLTGNDGHVYTQSGDSGKSLEEYLAGGGSDGTVTVYFDKSTTPGWANICAYCWDNNDRSYKPWAGEEMTLHQGSIYKYTFPEDYNHILFTNGASNGTLQTDDFFVSNGSVYTKDGDSGKNLEDYINGGGGDDPDPDPDPDPETVTVYFDNSASSWSPLKAYCWSADGKSHNKAWPGETLSIIKQDNIYEYTFSKSFINIQFNNGGDSGKTDDLVVVDGHVYTQAGDSGKNLEDYINGGGGDDPDPDPYPQPNSCYWIEPSKPRQDESAVIYFDPSKDGGKLKDVDEIYVHIWLVTNAGDRFNPTWCDNSAKYQMMKEDNGIFSLRLEPSIDGWFGNSADDPAKKIGIIFRDASGNTKQHSDDQYIEITPIGSLVLADKLGEFVSYSDENGTVTVTAENGKLLITPYAPNIVRVLSLFNGWNVVEPRESIAVIAEPNASYTISDRDASLEIKIEDGLTIHVDKENCLVDYHDADNNLLLYENTGMINHKGSQNATFGLQNSDTAFYGGGYDGGNINLIGKTVTMCNTQTGGWNNDLYWNNRPHNINVPFIVSTEGYGLFFDSVHNGSQIKPTSNTVSYSNSASNPVPYYFIGGGDMSAVLENYTALTGRADMPPYWAMGYITSRYGYESRTEAENVITRIKELGIPLDGIVFDLFWQGTSPAGMGNLAWNNSTFPNHQEMMQQFRDKGVHTLCITEPFFTSNCANYNTLKNNGYLADEHVNGMEWLLSEHSGLLDATNPEALAWMNGFYTARTAEGVDGWWLDLGEPERHDLDSHHMGGTYDQIHNEFGNLWVEATYKNLKEKFPDQRHMIMPRAGTAGIQRSGSFPWTGDIQQSWSGLQAQVPALVNASMSGINIGCDTGGFTHLSNTPELYERWFEFACFSPMMRSHGQASCNPEPFRSDWSSVKDHVKKFINYRYSYLPYLYSLYWANSTFGTPMARPANFADANKSTLAGCNDAYLWGQDIFVAPMLKSGSSRSVTFPEGRWYDLNNTNDIYEGGTTVDYSAPMGTLPHFARAGSIIVRYAADSFTSTKDIDHNNIRMDYYFDDAEVSQTSYFYDDDHTTTDPVGKNNYSLYALSSYNMDGNKNFGIRQIGPGIKDQEPKNVILTIHGAPDDFKTLVFRRHDDAPLQNAPAKSLSKVMAKASGIQQMNSVSSLDELQNNEAGTAYYQDGNKIHTRLTISPESRWDVEVNRDGIITGIEAVEAISATMTLSYGSGILSYSAPEGSTDVRIEVFTTSGLQVASFDSLEASGSIRQIPAELNPGAYIGVLSARTATGCPIRTTAKIIR